LRQQPCNNNGLVSSFKSVVSIASKVANFSDASTMSLSRLGSKYNTLHWSYSSLIYWP